MSTTILKKYNKQLTKNLTSIFEKIRSECNHYNIPKYKEIIYSKIQLKNISNKYELIQTIHIEKSNEKNNPLIFWVTGKLANIISDTSSERIRSIGLKCNNLDDFIHSILYYTTHSSESNMLANQERQLQIIKEFNYLAKDLSTIIKSEFNRRENNKVTHALKTLEFLETIS